MFTRWMHAVQLSCMKKDAHAHLPKTHTKTDTILPNEQSRDGLLTTISQNGLALRFADDGFKRDPGVVKAAVTQNGLAIHFASSSFKCDPEMLTLAMSTTRRDIFKYASFELRSNKPFALQAMSLDKTAYLYVSDALKDDADVLLAAMKLDATMYFHATPKLRNDQQMLMDALNVQGDVLSSIVRGLVNPDAKALVLAVVARDPNVLGCLQTVFRCDPDVVQTAIRSVLTTNAAFLLRAVKIDGSALSLPQKRQLNYGGTNGLWRLAKLEPDAVRALFDLEVELLLARQTSSELAGGVALELFEWMAEWMESICLQEQETQTGFLIYLRTNVATLLGLALELVDCHRRKEDDAYVELLQNVVNAVYRFLGKDEQSLLTY